MSRNSFRDYFQDGQNNLIFLYDNTPHSPNLSSFPHHKHLVDRVIACGQPNIAMVIQDAIAFLEEVASSDMN